jgi:hypothetical protein
MQYHEQVKIISRHIVKDSNGTVQEVQPSHCVKRRHAINGTGLTFPGLKQLERFYSEKKS